VILASLLLAAAPAATLVLPPDGPGGDAEWIAEAVADALPRALGQLGVPVVEREDRLRAHEALEIPARNLTRATSIRVAEALGATRVVLGGYDARQDAVSLSLRILDVERGSLSAPLIAGGPLQSLPMLLRGLAWDVAAAGPFPPSTTRQEFVAAAPAVPFEALRSLGRGLAATDAAGRTRLLRQAVAEHPGYDDARLILARAQLEARQSAAALDTLSRVAPGSPLLRRARFLQGLACLDLGRHREAAALFSSLAVPEPGAAVLNNYALALLRSGPTPEGVRASDVLRRARELEPGLGELPFNLGFALLVEGDGEAAAFWLQGVLRDDPGDSQARLALSWALRQLGRGAEADAEWREAVAQVPAWESLAAPDTTRRFERVVAWERSIELDQERWGDRQYAASHLGRGEKLQEAGDLGGARREFTQAAYLDPYSERAHLSLARLELREGQREKAVAELRMALWIREDVPVRLELMRLLAEMGRRGEARGEAERVLKLDPANAEARALLGKK
jgi:tetratricopeptide (TPR) repeat protein